MLRPLRADHIFSESNWFDVQQEHERRLSGEINGIDGNRLLNTAITDLVNYFVQTYQFDVPVLLEEEISVSQRETQIDVSRRFDYGFDRGSAPHTITGTSIDVTVPFSGNGQLFSIQPSTFSSGGPPMAKVGDGSLHFSIADVQLDPQRVRAAIDRTVNGIRQHLQWLRADVSGWNNHVQGLAQSQIEHRRQKLLADQNLVEAIGFAIKPREGAPRTYAAPEVRRKITPKLPPATSAAYRPEPTLVDSDYNNIISIMNNMAHVMERSPSAFIGMDEEALRTHFLVQLNGQYEGQATGETFNYEGKTDILLRSNGKNIFIAECKFWGGQKKFIETLNQLLGYTSWRDTKVAVVLFNRNKNFSQVLASIPATVAAHPNFKRAIAQPSETSFRYIFSHRDDANRELTLTVMVFDVPMAM